MRTVITILLWLLLVGVATAQSPPNGIPCNATSSGGAVTLCKPAWSYGCSASTQALQILSTDGNRTSIQFQNTGTIPIVLVFGDLAVPGNGFVAQPGNSYLWSNMSQGNTPGRVATTPVSIIANGSSTCVFLFTE
jgi:hypothetical protein